MEVETVTDLQREEEKLLLLLAQTEDFTEEQIAELAEQLPEIEEALERLKIAEEKLEALESTKRNLVEFEAMVLLEREKVKHTETLAEGQSPLKPEEFQRLLRSYPSLLPCPFTVPTQYNYHGYSTEQKYFLSVKTLAGKLLLEIDIEKEFLL